MKILLLGYDTLRGWLQSFETVLHTDDKISPAFIQGHGIEYIISYGYRHIIKLDVLALVPAINLHISYLPYNRGADPNLWSFLTNTPKGVTIHMIDKGVDTGEILCQKELFFDEEKETLKTSYDTLQSEIQTLFKDNWHKIKSGQLSPSKQPSGGSHHFKCQSEDLHINYNIPISQFKHINFEGTIQFP